MIVKSFIWELHGELLKQNIKNYVVVRLSVDLLHDKLFPNKTLPRVEYNYNRMKRSDRTWMPVIHLFFRSGDEINYQYQQGSHTAYCAQFFSDETSQICIMIRLSDVELFRRLFKDYSYEIFTIDEYESLLERQ